MEHIAMQVTYLAQRGFARGSKMLSNMLEAQLSLEEAVIHERWCCSTSLQPPLAQSGTYMYMCMDMDMTMNMTLTMNMDMHNVSLARSWASVARLEQRFVVCSSRLPRHGL